MAIEYKLSYTANEIDRKLSEGVYVGTGDMPPDYNVQIDPSGDALTIPTKLSELENDVGFIVGDGGFTEDGSGVIMPPTDPTLTVEGAAADAKAVGDKLALLSNYVTPQMFGAAADGETDDTDAIQSAINTQQPVVLSGEYAVNRTITGTSSYVYGVGATINIYQDIDTVFTFNGDIHISGIGFDCHNHSVQHCITSSNDDNGNNEDGMSNNIEICDINIRDVYSLRNDISTTLITVNGASTVHIDNIRVENCHQVGDGAIGNAEGNITCIYVANYTKHCSIQNITVSEVHNFDSVTLQPLFEDSNGIYVRSGVETAETTIKNIYGYNYGKRLIKSQCAGHIVIDGVTAYNNSIECLAAIGVMQYSSTIVGTASISNCCLTNECTDTTNAQYLITSDIESTIMNCILKSNDQHLAIYNNYKMTIYNCSVAGNGVHVDGAHYTHIYNCQFDIGSENVFLREYGAEGDAIIKVTDCTVTCGRSIIKHAQLFIDNCWIDWCHIETYGFCKLTNSTILGSAQVIYAGGESELVAENLTLIAKGVSNVEYAFDIDSSSTIRITNINATNFLYDVRIKSGNVILRGVNMEKVYCKGATSFENYPEYVANLPTPSFMTEGAKVILASDNKLYTFIGDEWVTDETSGSSGANINVDHSYNPDSKNAQSGKAVKEAVSKIVTIEQNTLSHTANYMPDKSEFVGGWINQAMKFYESSNNMISPFIEIDESLIGKKLTVQRRLTGVWERITQIKSVTAFNSITEPDANNNYSSDYVIQALADITLNSDDGTYAVYTIPEGTKYLRVAVGNNVVTNSDAQPMFVINDDESILGEYVANESVEVEGKKELTEDIVVNGSNLSEDAIQKINSELGKENGFVTPQMFGAVGDGVADDTVAVQTALDQGGVIYFPAGRYKTTSLLTVSKSCRIEMFKQYPNTYKKEYPLTSADNWMGARIDTYSPNGGMLIGDAVEVDGLYIRAMEGFAGVILKFDNTIGTYTYPAAARLKHIKLEIDSPNTIPVSMFDFLPDGSYHYILEDICLGRNGDAGYCEYGFRTDMTQTNRKWANNVTIRNLCIDLHADYPLYIAGDPSMGQIAGWVFDVLTIQSYVYNRNEQDSAINTTNRQGHINLVTLKNLRLTTFIGSYLWDVHEENLLGESISIENVASTAVIGCGSHFDAIESYFAPKMKSAENLNIENLEVSVADSLDGTANTVKLFDGTTEKTVDIPKVEMADEQIGNAIGTWMDANAQPKEVVGKNKLNIADDNCVNGSFYINSIGELQFVTNSDHWASNYIEVLPGDVIRTSIDGVLRPPLYIGVYNFSYELIEIINTSSLGTDGIVTTITNEEAKFIRVNLNCRNAGYYADRATAKVCITINNGDITYEDYYTELVGGIGSFMALQSPNGTKYTLDITDDGMIVGKDENGEIAMPNVPTKTSHLENDSGFITADDVAEASGVPTKVSQLENDSNFITDDKVPEIAEQAAALIDTALLSALGSGVIE